MFIFCGLYSKAKQDKGVAGTLHVVVVEGNYAAIGEPSGELFHVIPRCCTFLSIFTKLFLVLPTPPPPPPLSSLRRYLSGILNCLYIPQYHFHPLRYTVYSPLFFREIVDVDRWEEYKMPAGRGGCVIIRHVELNDRHLRSHGKKGNYEQSNFP